MNLGLSHPNSSQVTLEKSFTISLCPRVASIGFVPGRGAEQGLENKNVRGDVLGVSQDPVTVFHLLEIFPTSLIFS